MSEPTPPDKLVFQSNMQTASQKPTDYFAEQNQKQAEKKQKTSKIRKRIFLVGGLVALIIIAVVTILVINHQQSGPVVSDDAGAGDGTEISGGNSQLAGVQKLNEQVTEVFEPTYSADENGNIVVSGDLEAAEATFAAALANAANQQRIDTIYVAQIVFYSSLSDNQRVVGIAENVDPSKLNLSEKIKFYNLTYLAYAALGDTNQANRYYNLTREAASNTSGMGDSLWKNV